MDNLQRLFRSKKEAKRCFICGDGLKTLKIKKFGWRRDFDRDRVRKLRI